MKVYGAASFGYIGIIVFMENYLCISIFEKSGIVITI